MFVKKSDVPYSKTRYIMYGIWTERGNINRAIEKYNAMIMKICGFISELKEELKKGVFKFVFERKSRTEKDGIQSINPSINASVPEQKPEVQTALEMLQKQRSEMVVRIADDGHDAGAEVISEWVAKKPKIAKLIKRARDKRRYRGSSDEFDSLTDENAVPLLDLMEQLELNELSELITTFYDVYSRKDSIPDILHKMKECIGFISDLCAIRNAAAHGRSILPTFMDPDYNGNWDLEFDNVEGRCSVEKWILYDLLKKKWERMGLGDYSKQIVNTLYGNPLRRAWIELNYIYFYIIREIEKMSFKLFVTEAEWFLSKEEDIRQQMSGVNLCSLRLSDMGNTTLDITAPPYDEIAQEAFSVWELFEGKYYR